MDRSTGDQSGTMCPLCVAADAADAGYCRHVVATPERRRHCIEAIAATLGFCVSHAELIEAAAEHGADFDELLAAAAARLVEHFQRAPDHARDALFDAQRACPACQWGEQRATRAAHWLLAECGEERARWPALCIDHVHTAIRLAPDAALQPLLAQQGERLRDGAGLAQIGGSPRPARRQLARMRRLVAARRFDRVEELFDDPTLCPVCAWIARTIEHWIESVRTAVRIRADAQTVFPLCARHVWIAADACRDAAGAIAAHAAAVARRALALGLDAIRRDEQADAEAKTNVWYRRRSPAYVLGRRRRAAFCLPACLPCLLTATALEFAVESLVDALGSHRQRQRLERGHGLCAKHFAHAVLLAGGRARDALWALELAKLRDLAGLRSAALAAGHDPEPHATAKRSGAALSHFSAVV